MRPIKARPRSQVLSTSQDNGIMPKRRNTQSIPRELPPCVGPKLQQFQHHDSPIQWGERLGGDQSTPAQGYVFRAKIKDREYAIKVFKFFDPTVRESHWRPLMGKKTPLDTIAYYTDPFYCECRAYGQINNCIKKRKPPPLSGVATPCHGFLFLQKMDEKILKDRGVHLHLDRVDQRYQRQAIGGIRARAIVKDIAAAESGVSESTLKSLLRGILDMNRHGIYNRDIRLDNYQGGQIVDFGSAWTEPHALLNKLDDFEARETKLEDRAKFNEMVEEEGLSYDVVDIHSMRLRRR